VGYAIDRRGLFLVYEGKGRAGIVERRALKGGGALPRRNETLHREGNIFRVLYEGKRKRFQTVRTKKPWLQISANRASQSCRFLYGLQKYWGIDKEYIKRKFQDRVHHIRSEVPLYLIVFIGQLVCFRSQWPAKLPTLFFKYASELMYKTHGVEVSRPLSPR
jgi:hypothetical protein